MFLGKSGSHGPVEDRNRKDQTMKRFFRVATLSRYVLVEAADETEARTLGESALRELFPDLMAKTTVRSVTFATAEDIELWRWHQDFLARERDQ
jgi:hypothetical protein